MDKELNEAVEELVSTAKKNKREVLVFACDDKGVGSALVGRYEDLAEKIIATLVENRNMPGIRRIRELLTVVTGYLVATDANLMRNLNMLVREAEEAKSNKKMHDIMCIPMSNDIN